MNLEFAGQRHKTRNERLDTIYLARRADYDEMKQGAMKMWNRNAWLSTLFLFGGALLFAVLGDRLGLPAPFYFTVTGLILLAVAGLLWPIYKDAPIDGKLGNPLYVALFYAGGGAWIWLAMGLMSIGITAWLAFPGAFFLAGVVLIVAGGVWRLDMAALSGWAWRASSAWRAWSSAGSSYSPSAGVGSCCT
ncbi:hypothetical protein AB0M48_05535 [Lentzea sp. NPDC051208]|uniref:hypothetical protein n=1 Tax=Lentzea sp. NPDC051208 TaxID=3154642 RepID=UPI00343EDFA8